MLRKSTGAVLLLVLGVFSLGGAIEVVHPVEEAPHGEHPLLDGTQITAQLPCEGDSHAHRHHCLHGQQLTAAIGFDAATGSEMLRRVEQSELLEPTGRIIVQFLQRGPPSC